MQEMKLIDAVAAKTAIKNFFKKQIDEEYHYWEVTDCNADILTILNALPSVPTVPLEVHEKMKRELNNEIICLKAEIEDLKIIKGNALEIISTGQKQMLEIRNNSIKEFADNAIERVEKSRQKYQRLCKEQGEEIDEAMNIHFNGMINILKELAGEG